MRFVLTALVLLCSLLPAEAQEVPREVIAKTIEEGVDYLVGQQQPDGSWGAVPAKASIGGMPVAKAALVTLALLHAKLPKSAEAVNKGVAYVTQHAPERMTYSAGAVLSMLFKHGRPEKHTRLIHEYMWRLIQSQKPKGPQAGSWGYYMVAWGPRSRDRTEPEGWDVVAGRSDQSNMQFAVLALHFARRSGYQVPRKTWERVHTYYVANQNQDGGWGYYGEPYLREHNEPLRGAQSNPNMTLASTISLYLVEEALYTTRRDQSTPPKHSRTFEAGLKWVADNWRSRMSTYGWYAAERLGILTGRSNFGTHWWYQEGARHLTTNRNWQVGQGDRICATALAVLFLARGLEPIIINKLQRTGDWNNTPHDAQHVVEHIEHHFQKGVQWRIVTLDAPMELLLKTPILYITGGQKLILSEAEKAKLKSYVEQGGCILGVAYGGRKPFDESFRALVAELFPEGKLARLPKDHTIYTSPKRLGYKPALEELKLGGQQGRPAVIYSPYDLCTRWNSASKTAIPALDIAANVYFYVNQHSPLTK